MSDFWNGLEVGNSVSSGKKTQFRSLREIYTVGDIITFLGSSYEVTAVRNEPLNHISAEDCKAEGHEPDWDAFYDLTMSQDGWDEPEELIEECEDECDWVNYGNRLVHSREHKEWLRDREELALRLAFKKEWDAMHGDGSFDSNPIAQVVTFKRQEKGN